MMRADLYDIGGFDERFAKGLGYDDDDFVQRIQLKPMSMKIPIRPMVVHQHHVAYFQEGISKMKELMNVNYVIKLRNREQGIVDVKKFNTIYK